MRAQATRMPAQSGQTEVADSVATILPRSVPSTAFGFRLVDGRSRESSLSRAQCCSDGFEAVRRQSDAGGDGVMGVLIVSTKYLRTGVHIHYPVLMLINELLFCYTSANSELLATWLPLPHCTNSFSLAAIDDDPDTRKSSSPLRRCRLHPPR